MRVFPESPEHPQSASIAEAAQTAPAFRAGVLVALATLAWAYLLLLPLLHRAYTSAMGTPPALTDFRLLAPPMAVATSIVFSFLAWLLLQFFRNV